MLYSAPPAALAFSGILRPSGPVKNSGKIVTTLMRSVISRRYRPLTSPLLPALPCRYGQLPQADRERARFRFRFSLRASAPEEARSRNGPHPSLSLIHISEPTRLLSI